MSGQIVEGKFPSSTLSGIDPMSTTYLTLHLFIERRPQHIFIKGYIGVTHGHIKKKKLIIIIIKKTNNNIKINNNIYIKNFL